MIQNEIDLINYINSQINENIVLDDRKQFVTILTKELDGICHYDLKLDDKYTSLYIQLLQTIEQSEATIGINIHLIVAALKHDYLLP